MIKHQCVICGKSALCETCTKAGTLLVSHYTRCPSCKRKVSGGNLTP